MAALDWLAAAVLFFELPVPLFWLILHSLVRFWRRHPRAAYWVAGLTAWGAGAALLGSLHEHLFASSEAPLWGIVLGLGLIAADGYLLARAEREMGPARILGRAELAGTGELATGGLYARVRHPRYAGMMLAVLGACLTAASLLLWVMAAAWYLLALFMLQLEERELRARFGAAYQEYSRRVPALLPFRVFSSRE